MAVPKGWLYKFAMAAFPSLYLLPIGGCHSSPPESFFVTGNIRFSRAETMPIHDAYVWRQPIGNTAVVLLSDRPLPTLPEDDPFPVVDLGLILDWSRAPLAELAVDAQGTLLGYSARTSTGGGVSAECTHNPGACYSAVDYWNEQASWGDEAISASYGFGHEVDVALAQPIRRQARFQTPVLSRYGAELARIDAQGKATQTASDDYANMFARYQRARAALDENSPPAFLQANGYGAALAEAMLKFDGLFAAITRLAETCPRIDSYESFGNDGGFGSLLIHHGNEETLVYFLRRGDDWIVQQCGTK